MNRIIKIDYDKLNFKVEGNIYQLSFQEIYSIIRFFNEAFYRKSVNMSDSFDKYRDTVYKNRFRKDEI